MNTPILQRLSVRVSPNSYLRTNEWSVYDPTNNEVYGRGSHYTWADAWDGAQDCLCKIAREWPDCQDQTLNTELKYRKTITSSCGRLKVTESL